MGYEMLKVPQTGQRILLQAGAVQTLRTVEFYLPLFRMWSGSTETHGVTFVPSHDRARAEWVEVSDP